MTDNLPKFAARMPKRIQRSRAKGWRKPPGAVIVDRTSRWGNPFPLVENTAADRRRAVELYRDLVTSSPFKIAQIRYELRGKDLVCWCPLDQPCHADVLLELANADPAP